MDERRVLLKGEHIKKYFPVKASGIFGKPRTVRAVDDVSLEIMEGETVGLVGESGCGKSTLGRALIRLTDLTDGKVVFDGKDISALPEWELRNLRCQMQIVFQDPYSSLNPRMTIHEALRAPLENFPAIKGDKEAKIIEIARRVGINEEWLYRYPHEFSGGQRQRIVIARALILNPRFVVCDEAVSALDVSVRSQVLNLMSDLQKEMNLTYLFISHDLSVIKHISDRIMVMYLGKIVEVASKHELLDNPLHPYTQALISAIPKPVVGNRRNRIVLSGDLPSPINPPTGCPFHPRCPKCSEICRNKFPLTANVGNGHEVACHLVH